MYDIRQFRPMLYTLLLLGFCGYALAAETPGLWLLAVGGTLLNGYLVRRQTFRPIPRLAANIITLLFAGWMVARVRMFPGPPIFAIGEFLTFLQLVKLYEQRGNRDIAQLLVLSLLLMIAAAISTASLLFGIVFVVYLFLSLYCCLLFHLKAESDHARLVSGIRDDKINEMTLRQDQRFLSRSMRRLAAVVSAFAVITAVAVFLLFPRGSGAGMIGNMAFQPSQTMTGFSDQIDFQDVARIQQNDAQIAWVTVRKNRQPWGAGEVIYLRGNVCDTYVSDVTNVNRWRWLRSTEMISMSMQAAVSPNGADLYEQDIRLLPTGTKTLFALPGLQSFKTNRDLKINRGEDDVLTTSEEGRSERVYTAVSTNANAIPAPELARQPMTMTATDRGAGRMYPVPPEVKSFAQRDEVAGSDAGGNLATQRLDRPGVSEIDEALARNFETYLRTKFLYTLDLTDARVVNEKDPIVQFLYDFQRGHCEYFAGAMALMCQSVGIKARVVVGFKCDDFNTMGGYYVVRQSHAHAWVEALTANGWQRFDPTAINEAGAAARTLTLWQRVRSAVNFLEYKWGSSVVNYDSESQANIVSRTENSLSNTAMSTTGWVQQLKDFIGAKLQKYADWANQANFYAVLVLLISVAIVALVVGTIVVLLLRLRLYRRARRIGLEALSNNDQRRLARQLAFYDQMLQTLERRKIQRASHLTPREFGASVGFLPAEAYDLVQRLTRVFYRVRYGEAELQPAQQKRLARSVERIDLLLGPAD
ncbi:MAG TPA: DUF3488 and transglutaminase-like domain-containing protein [Tepidisphaeraceae bacterium]|jgi:transglutaminase-like putative cysteine protease